MKELKGVRMNDFKLIDHIQTAVAVIDANMTVIEENESFKNRHNKDCSTAIGMKCFNASYGFSNSCGEENSGDCPVKKSFLSKKSETAIHHYWIKGQAVVEELSTTPIIEANGDVNYVIEEFRDLTKLLGLNKGIISTCSYCKKIRDENNQWVNFDVYLHRRTGADFSHGICEECYDNATKHFKGKHSCSN